MSNGYYVDKTALIQSLIAQGRYYFLSRPRRFGKSLLVSTIEALFECQEELFRGLDIYEDWDWSSPHPVLRLSFGGKFNEPGELEKDIIEQLEGVEETNNLSPPPTFHDGPRRLRNLIRQLHSITNKQVVVIIDEYDKPILDVLDNVELAKSNREHLRGFYGSIKDCARHIRFVFVKGVNMFSKVSLFSGLNLIDISLDRRYATICGYTDKDIDTVFASELEGLDRDKMRQWYNGYNWLGNERVYNPLGVLFFFRDQEFNSYWFQTATPDFLFRMLEQKKVATIELEKRFESAVQITRFDINDIDLAALMFQTGYLTIIGEESINRDVNYILDYPNLEVRKSFNQQF